MILGIKLVRKIYREMLRQKIRHLDYDFIDKVILSEYFSIGNVVKLNNGFKFVILGSDGNYVIGINKKKIDKDKAISESDIEEIHLYTLLNNFVTSKKFKDKKWVLKQKLILRTKIPNNKLNFGLLMDTYERKEILLYSYPIKELLLVLYLCHLIVIDIFCLHTIIISSIGIVGLIILSVGERYKNILL